MSDAARVRIKGGEDNDLVADVTDGGGHPVILLHGGGQTRKAWDATARSIAARGMRAIAVDQRGHGESDWIASKNYAFDAFAADAVAMVGWAKERFGETPSVVGASLGGISALTAEARHGPLFADMVLVDIIPRLEESGVARVQGFMAERMEEGFATLEEAADAISAYLPHRKRPSSLGGLAKNLRRDPDGRYRWHWDPAFIKGPRNINHLGRELMGELTAALPKLSLPVLLVRGMQSELVNEEAAREFVSLVPGAAYVDVSGAGHMVAGDRNDVFSDAILDFFSHRQAMPAGG